MWTPKSELIHNSQKLDVSFGILNTKEAEIIRANVIQKHTPSGYFKGRLFESVTDDISCADKDSIHWLKKYPHQNGIYVFFEETEGKDVFEFNHISDFLSVYDECPLFTFYITDSTCAFLISYTCEQTLVCTASAADWLEAMLAQK